MIKENKIANAVQAGNNDAQVKKMEKDTQIKVDTYNWGPCVIKLKILDNFKKLLLDEAEKNKAGFYGDGDYRHKLAGQLDTEIGYSQESKDVLGPELAKYLGVYDQMFQKFQNKKYETSPHYALTALWINYQRKHEFNPPHDHDGALSFVIYLDIPEALHKENKEYIGKSCGPGGIQFIYGEGNRQAITYMSEIPTTGDMFVFPAWLKHWVSPFHSDVTRISVSGNVHDKVPISTLPKNFKVRPAP